MKEKTYEEALAEQNKQKSNVLLTIYPPRKTRGKKEKKKAAKKVNLYLFTANYETRFNYNYARKKPVNNIFVVFCTNFVRSFRSAKGETNLFRYRKRIHRGLRQQFLFDPKELLPKWR